MTVDLNELEAVLAKATPGEWQQQHTDFEDGGVAIVAHIVEGGVVLETPTNGMVCWANMLPVERDQYDDDRASANAAAIVTLHNAAPALIAEHRAALARVEALEKRLSSHADWLQGAAAGDFEDAAADCGVTVGMVVQQEMREQLRRIRAALEPKP